MKNLPEIFGSKVFNDNIMRSRLTKDVYSALQKTILSGKQLEREIANVIASAMKEWAVELGATHFTHWFQPMTGITAEKHESFILPDGSGGIILEFSGKELIKGEPDASSFPSGGLRATFEARGYTAWDPTSYAFIKDDTLCIPTAFCSYSGEALDKKTPLLRSMQALDFQALRILRLFGNIETNHVIATVGAEQEYFLIDKEKFLQREDLMYCGRTLFGAKPPKGQEMAFHYFGRIKQRVADFMKELDTELWKLGVYAKIKHNEAAPAQHELVPIFGTANLASDHNQLIMELMQSIATKHGMTCLLHEKPFDGVNGSGKHNNWSISTDLGINLLEPGETPHENAQFLLFLLATIKAVDEYQDLLRVSVASAGNDHRLGSHEAPPAIVSIFLGDELSRILDAIEQDMPYNESNKTAMQIGVSALPHFPKDTTDRNRTSPFAFTGNKFEFRMPGSSFSISGPNIITNTIVAESLRVFADKLEKAKDFKLELAKIIKETIKKHKRIIFNGNGYDESWVVEAEKRGLLNLKTTPDALPTFIDKKNIALFERHAVFTSAEIYSRYEIMMENYCKIIHIEALTLLNMARKHIIPSVLQYQKELVDLITSKKAMHTATNCEIEEDLLKKLIEKSVQLKKEMQKLQNVLENEKLPISIEKATIYSRDMIFASMQTARKYIDFLEQETAQHCWKLPTYGNILYSVN